MEKFKFYNKIMGWIIFAIALATYSLTMEPTGSLWDCGEFLSGAKNLAVVHPPGAPLFLMLGRIFMLFSFGDVTKAAMMVNFMSALCTAFCSLFFFWSLTILLGRIAFKEKEYSLDKVVAVLGSAFVAALAATFLDSMWFSAVEGEVYALSVFFMTINTWAILRWYEDNSAKADRWLLFIGISTGLSIGVHLLSLLVFPMVAVVYYFKKFNANWKGVLIAFILSLLFIFFVTNFVISGIPEVMQSYEIMFVNSFGMPFNSGVIFAFILLLTSLYLLIAKSNGKDISNSIIYAIGGLYLFGYLLTAFNADTGAMGKLIPRLFIVGLIYALAYSRKYVQINTIVLFFTFIVIGYSSYIMVPIRANAHPALNMNSPTDAISMLSYLNREQYGDRPLVKGPDYTASQYDLEEVIKKGKIWRKNEATGKYDDVGEKYDYKFRKNATIFFPRMGFWMEDRYKQAFRAWLNPDVYIADRAQENEPVQAFPGNRIQEAEQKAAQMNQEANQPGRYFVKDDVGMKENLKFFFQYQIGFMYMRYLMWNFAGRTDDPQGTYANDEGRWQSGINFIDNAVGSLWGNATRNQEGKPAELTSNRANNKFYLIPFILCVIGIVYHFSKNPFNFSVVFVLWFVTGLMQVVFHNQPPIEPRERDYVYAPSFWAFCLWMGFGCYAIYEFLINKGLKGLTAPAVAILLAISAPILMGMNGWDDHDRSKRYTTVAFAKDMLMSCDSNAILFTYGDNDTYPLWYAQEVEGYRTDVRVVNLSLLGVDWYINQLRFAANKSKPLKLTISQDKLNGNKRDMLRFSANGYEKNRIDLINLLKFVSSDRKEDKMPQGNNELENYIPSQLLSLDVDVAKTVNNNIIPKESLATLAPKMEWSLPTTSLQKNDLVTLDIIANNMFDRPICFAISCSPSTFQGLDNYVQMDGLIYRVVPAINPLGSQQAAVYVDKMYDRLMKFEWGNMDKHPVLMDENTVRGLYNIKTGYSTLASALIQKGDTVRALKAVDYFYAHMPRYNVKPDRFELSYPGIYYMLGQKEKGKALLDEQWKYNKHILDWASNEANREVVLSDIYECYQVSRNLAQISMQVGESKLAEEITKASEDYKIRFGFPN